MRAVHNCRANAALLSGKAIIYIRLVQSDKKPLFRRHPMLRFLAQRVKAYRDYRTVIGQLSHMSIQELDDIGITRADIDRIARGAMR
jgi:uncharacterized protein YjiS (DUF1127 family)